MLILKTSQGPEYQIVSADTTGTQYAFLVYNEPSLLKVIRDLDNCGDFSLFDTETDEYDEFHNCGKIIMLTRQTDTSYFITLERGDG